MARITTYPNDSNVTAGDKLIGTDVDNLDATKNFTVGSLQSFFGLTFVPYTGATQNVDLGNFWLITNGKGSFGQLDVNGPTALTGTTTVNGFLTASAIKAQFGLQLQSGPFELGNALNPGNTGDVLISQGPGVEPTWVPATAFLIPAATSYYSTVTQSYNAVAAIPSLMEFENVDVFNSDIQVLTNALGKKTKITFFANGVYSLQVSAQLLRAPGGGQQKASFWLRKNGTDIPNSNRHSGLLASNDYFLHVETYLVDVQQNDFIEVAWVGVDILLNYEGPVAGPPPIPGTSSTMLDVYRVLST